MISSARPYAPGVETLMYVGGGPDGCGDDDTNRINTILKWSFIIVGAWSLYDVLAAPKRRSRRKRRK